MKKMKGVLFILLAAIGFSMMTFLVRLSGDIPTMQKVFFRNLVAGIIAIGTLAGTKEKFYIKKGSWPGLLLRSSFGAIGMVLNFWAIDHLGLADSNILNKMSPFFAILFSILVMKEIPTRFDWAAVMVAFTGAVFVVRPTAGLASFPALVGLLSGMFAGAAYTMVRYLGKKKERTPVIVMVFSVFTSLMTLPFLIFDYHPMSIKQTCYLILAGCFAALGQFSITTAYKYAPAKELSVFDYMQVIFAAMLGILFLHEVPTALSFVGYAIIITAAVGRWWYNLKHAEDVAAK